VCLSAQPFIFFEGLTRASGHERIAANIKQEGTAENEENQ
jgi:hypothetical protein